MNEKKDLFLRIDGAFMTVTRWFSRISPIILVIMALIATANVLLAKLFMATVPGNVYMITYFLVPVIYFSVSHELLYRGMTYVDIFTVKFPNWLNAVISFLSNIIGGFVFALIGWCNITKMESAIQYKTMSEAGTGGFLLWPFYLVLVAMCILLGVCFLWSAARVVYYKGNIPFAGAVGPDTNEEKECDA